MKRMKGNQSKEKRLRNVAHLWADKQTIRYFRHNYPKAHYKNLHLTYLALCEMDSDFGEGKQIRGFTKTVATYAGMNENTIRKYIRALCRLHLIDYEQENIDGRFGKTTFIIYKWSEPTEEQKEISLNIIDCENRATENRRAVNPLNGETSPYKNNNKLLGTSKNPKGSESKGDPPSSWKSLSKEYGQPRVIFVKKFLKAQQKNYPKIIKGDISPNHTRILSSLDCLDKLCRIDGYDFETEVLPVLEEVPADKFWSKNLLSLGSLRNSSSNGETKFVNICNTLSSETSSSPKQQQQQTPKQIIEREFSVSMAHMITQDCFNPAASLLTNADNGAESELAQNMVDFARWFKKKQQRPNWRDLDPKDPHQHAIRCKWEDEIPTAWGFVQKYIEWLAEQQWLDEITPANFTSGNRIIQKFVQHHQKQIGLNIFTGERR